ncbi:MAG: phosphotransferase [Deltaproteobacteria bacterium]|nr:phosphotransferase [Deltaproteobacteria bacterium]MBW2121559.1 phosphotransferase [Deltaproteobacteria bacterium]
MRVIARDLLGFVRSSLPGGVVDIAIEKLGGDASDRNYYRLHLDRNSPELPATVVLMELAAPFAGEELPFVNVLRTLERSGLGVPRLYGLEPGQGLVLLEDLGDEILQRKIEGKKAGEIGHLYQEALDGVVKMQWDLPAGQDCPAFKTAFTVERFLWELDFFRANYIEALLGRSIHPEDLKAMGRLFLLLATLLDGERKVFTHRDYHSRNLIYHGDRLKMLDFQDARMGPPLYDVASLLRDSYVVLEDPLVESLLDYYLSETERRRGKKIDRSRARFIFDIASLQRNLKAIGTFAYQAVERKNPAYLKYIPPTLAYVESNLQRHEELSSYREILARYLPRGGAGRRGER